MKYLHILCGIFLLNFTSYAGQDYLERFKTYLNYTQNLNQISNDPSFFKFIEKDAPLSNKLREKWLYDLAQNKNWSQFNKFYRKSPDINLFCLHLIALHQLSFIAQARDEAVSIWKTGEDKPGSCNTYFDLLRQTTGFNEDLITQRIKAALHQNNFHQALLLLKHYKVMPVALVKIMLDVYQSPQKINQIPKNNFSSAIYLYGLKRLVVANMDKALTIWEHDKHKNILDESQQQQFFVQVALYKTMRNHQDVEEWFAKIKPAYRSDLLLEWQIRSALKKQKWQQATTLIAQSQNQDDPIWKYWLARTLSYSNNKDALNLSKITFEKLAANRNYYGFLASYQSHLPAQFHEEQPEARIAVLSPYQEILDQIKNLYSLKEEVQASRLLNDFISELPKNEASALALWVADSLHWYGKSVYLSNTELLNDHLSLRFPIAYKEIVSQQSEKYQIPKELIYAIIRQESGFRTNVISTAGAKGLMQIMPYTARVISKAEKIPLKNSDALYQAQTNIRIGSAYLKYLAKRFNNHPVLIAAAYNAGPKQVVNWMKTHPPYDMDLWIETLPWQETRNYLKNVMAFYAVYQYRMKHKVDISAFLKPFKQDIVLI